MSRILSQLRKVLDFLPAGSTREIVVLLGVVIVAPILEAAGVGLIFGAIGILLGGDSALQGAWVAGTYAFSGLGADVA